jgi:hypothetical protein
MTTALEAVTATHPIINRAISAFMLDEATIERGKAFGIHPRAYYFGGRGGVLGDVDADVVTAAFGLWHPGMVRRFWEEAIGTSTAAALADDYAALLGAWGRDRLGDGDGLERLAELAERVAAAADPAGLALFAGWRALPLPDDPLARVAQLLMVLREHRGGLYIAAVLSQGLTPLETILTAGGADHARFHGWREELPEIDEDRCRAAREKAEQITDTLDTHPYETLPETDLDEFVTLIQRVKTSLRAAP